jgi:hypothetical protein
MSCKGNHSIYNYTTTFNIEGEQGLEDLWSYCIFRLNLEYSAYTYDRFARLYNFLNEHSSLISKENNILISLQESSDEYFISVDTQLFSILRNFSQRLELLHYTYHYHNNLLNYAIAKKDPNQVPIKEVKKSKRFNCYTFLVADDLEEMQSCIEKLQDANYKKVFQTLTIEELSAYRTTFSYYSSYLKLYSQLQVMSSIIAELSVILSLYQHECLQLGTDFRSLIESFLNNLEYWQDKLFITGGEELHFMDDSFKADLSQIKMALGLYDDIPQPEQSNLDDIFNF